MFPWSFWWANLSSLIDLKKIWAQIFFSSSWKLFNFFSADRDWDKKKKKKSHLGRPPNHCFTSLHITPGQGINTDSAGWGRRGYTCRPATKTDACIWKSVHTNTHTHTHTQTKLENLLWLISTLDYSRASCVISSISHTHTHTLASLGSKYICGHWCHSNCGKPLYHRLWISCEWLRPTNCVRN